MSSEGASTVGARLVEMDKLLRDIQLGLVPDREPAPPLAPAAGPEPPAAEPEPPAAGPEPPAAEPEPPAAGPEPPAAEPEPPAAAVPEPARAATVTAPPATDAPQLQALTELSTRLLASIRELLAGYERVLVLSAPARPPARRAARHWNESPDVTLAAGPFAGLEALREFERAVSRLPGVRDVAVRGYEGTDRAIIEVRLDLPNP